MGTPLFNLQYQSDPSGMGGSVFGRVPDLLEKP
jgi:hypothetical protein